MIDLGALHEVVAVSLHLWGTPANPQTVELSTALAPSLWEGWVLVDTIDVPSPTSVHHKQKLLQPVQARYWKVHCRSNWGATWGMGMQRIRFVAGDGALAGNLASRTAGGSDATVLAHLAHYAHSTFVHRGVVSADLKSAVVAAAAAIAVLLVACTWSRLPRLWTPWATTTYTVVQAQATGAAPGGFAYGAAVRVPPRASLPNAITARPQDASEGSFAGEEESMRGFAPHRNL